MSATHRLSGFQVHAIATAVLLATFVAVSPLGAATSSAVYYANGEQYLLERSETELAIEFLGADTAVAADVRFETLRVGTVEPLPWGPIDGRFGILRVDRADLETADRAAENGLVRSVRRVYRFVPGGYPHLGTGRLVAKLAEGVSEDDFDAALAEHAAVLVKPVSGLQRTYLVEPVDRGTDEAELASRMHRDQRIEWAHPDLISPLFKTQAFDGSSYGATYFGDGAELENIDEFAPLQWHLHNTGQEDGVIGADINLAEAFGAGVFGAGTVVGMLDDACDVLHEDLLGNYTNTSHNAVTGDIGQLAANPSSDGERHGTSMMGLMCASLNGVGVVGVAPQARFTASRGADQGLSTADIAGAYSFAKNRNVDVYCNAWAFESGSPSPETVRATVEDAFQTGRDGLGMVVVFPTGNGAEDLAEDSALAGLTDEDGQKLVIGVGACNARDMLASYSSYGVGVVDVVAPSGDVFLPQLVTTDNTDEASFAVLGYNRGGFDDLGQANLADSSYTQGDSFREVDEADFFGTSAACAQVAGVASLILSGSGPDPTATQVRSIIEHTAVQIPISDPTIGDYNYITGRSLKYGYGRVDAGAAAAAAQLITFNSPYTWPERVKDVKITLDGELKTLRWEKNDDLRPLGGDEVRGDETISVLVVQRVGLDFEWVPSDGQNYYDGQTVDHAQKVTVAQVGDNTSYEFDDSLGLTYFGIFAQNDDGRYSFGVSIDSDGKVVEVGRSANLGASEDNENGNTTDPTGPDVPTVSIDVTPTSGESPLKVSFRGNSPESDSPIESASWDFGDGSDPTNSTVAEHEYVLPGTTRQQYTATFTVIDADGDVGKRSVIISVSPPEGVGEDASSGSVRIIIQDTSGKTLGPSDVAEVGDRLVLSVDTSRIVGDPQSVFWNLGDATQGKSFIVSHSYEFAGGFPVTVQVTAETSSGDTLVFQATRLLTVSGTSPPDNGNSNTPTPSTGGTASAPCGAGMLLPMFAILGVAMLRRLRAV